MDANSLIIRIFRKKNTDYSLLVWKVLEKKTFTNVETPRNVKISRFSVKIVKIDLNLAGNQLTLRKDFEVINVWKLYKTIKNMFNEVKENIPATQIVMFWAMFEKCRNTSKSQNFTIFGENRKNRPQFSGKSVDFE